MKRYSINGAEVEEQYLIENINEALSYKWDKENKDTIEGHKHCLICSIELPDEDKSSNSSFYKSNNNSLCSYCYEIFIINNKGIDALKNL